MVGDVNAAIEAVGHSLLSGVFVWAGFNHFLNFDAVAGMIASRGYPLAKPGLIAASIVEIVAGACIAIGAYRAPAAIMLIAFTIAATAALLDFWRFTGPERDALKSTFTINFAVVGGLMLTASRAST